MTSRNNPGEVVQEASDEDSESRLIRSCKKKISRRGLEDSDEDNSEIERCDNTIVSSNDVIVTPRSSQRLKDKLRKQYTIPSREEALDRICKGDKKESNLRRRNLTSEFVMGRSRYVTDITDIFESSGSDLSDFLDDSEETRTKTRPKRKKRKKNSVIKKELSDSDDYSANEKASQKRSKNKYKVVSENDEKPDSSRQDEESSDTYDFAKILPSKKQKKKRMKKELKSESDEDNIPKTNRNHRRQTKTLQKRKSEALLEKLSAKRSSAKSKQLNITDVDLASAANVEKELYDKGSSSFDYSDHALSSSLLKERDSDREFIVDDHLSDGDSGGVTESFKHLQGAKDTAVNSNDLIQSPKKKLDHFQRVYSLPDSEESDSEISSYSPGMVAIYNAVKENNMKGVRAVIESNPGVVHELGSKRQSLLHTAAVCGYPEITQLLVDFGSDKWALDALSLPPIGYALLYSHVECLKILLKQTVLNNVDKILKDHYNLSLLHFVVYGSFVLQGFKYPSISSSSRIDSLQVLFQHNKLFCLSLMESKDSRGLTPLAAAICAGQHQCVQYLLKEGASQDDFQTTNGGNLLHFAVECSTKDSVECNGKDLSYCLRALLSTSQKSDINAIDGFGFTPLMLSAANGNYHCVSALLESGASVHFKDKHGTTSLHLAAASGDPNCVKLLLEYDHQVDCLDSSGWPPLLYANFAAHENCVLSLMESNPKQIFVLGDLLRRGSSEAAKERNFKVVKDVLVALANHDAYYRVFNDFIRHNQDLLEVYDKGLLHQTWIAILDFDNKLRWLRRKLAQDRGTGVQSVFLEVNRDAIFESAMHKLKNYSGNFLRNCAMAVKFADEPGICTGPTREFFVNICKDIVEPRRQLFHATDDNLYSLSPNAFFAERAKSDNEMNERLDIVNFSSMQSSPATRLTDSEPCTRVSSSFHCDVVKNCRKFSKYVDQKLAENLDQLKFIGRIIGTAICQGHFLNLHLSKPLVKQILGIQLNHPDDLGYLDYQLHKNLVSFILEGDDVSELMLPCELEHINPWNRRLTKVQLFPEDRKEDCLTDDNKAEFVELVSKYKLTVMMQKEMDSLCQGLYEVIPRGYFSIFNADEFSLLINGVDKINVEDWRNNTMYSIPDPEKRDEIKWFWEIVSELKEEEKALLLKFSTGSPCVPSGGFADLQGLSGPTKFQITINSERNKIPRASTCFNMLELTSYDSAKKLKDKLLIAIRHGTEGFCFS